MTDSVESVLQKLAKEMGDAGYCNYAACREYLQKAFEAGVEAAEQFLRDLKEQMFCQCAEPYFGAQVVGTPLRCERCNKEVVAKQALSRYPNRAHVHDLSDPFCAIRPEVAEPKLDTRMVDPDEPKIPLRPAKPSPDSATPAKEKNDAIIS